MITQRSVTLPKWWHGRVWGYSWRGLFCLLLAAGGVPAWAAETSPPLPLSLEESILLALKNNLDIRVEGFTPQIREAQVTQAKAAFDPTAFLEGTVGRTRDQSTSTVTGTPGSIRDEKTQEANAGVRQLLITGGTYELRFDNTRFETSASSAVSALNPHHKAELSLTLKQPFLKNFGPTVNRIPTRIAETNREIAVDQWKQRISDTITAVQGAYWDLVFAIENFTVQQRSRALARDLVELNRARVRAGVAAPVEVIQAETQVAAREQDVILAEKAVRDAEDQLRLLLNLPDSGAGGRGPIRPTDVPSFTPLSLDVERSIEEALQKRPEVHAAKETVTSKELSLRFTRNQLLPDLRFEGSVGVNGLERTYTDATDRLGTGETYSYSAGIILEIPLGNRAARAGYDRAGLETEQARESLQNLTRQIVSQVREAVRRIEADAKRVEANRAARALAEEQLRVERRRLEAGVTTTFNVLQFQRDLAAAAAQEIRAITDYNKSVANLGRATGVILDKYTLRP